MQVLRTQMSLDHQNEAVVQVEVADHGYRWHRRNESSV